MIAGTYTGYALFVWDREASRAWFVGRRASMDDCCIGVDSHRRDPLASGDCIGVHVRDNVVTWAVSDSWAFESGWSVLAELVAAGEAQSRPAGPGTYAHTDVVLPYALLDLEASRARSAQLAAGAMDSGEWAREVRA